MENVPALAGIGLGGLLGALANIGLGGRALVLPHVKGHRVYPGFLGQLVVCLGVAYAVDHDPQTAFFASLCGTALLRHIKRRIESTFDGARSECDDQ